MSTGEASGTGIPGERLAARIEIEGRRVNEAIERGRDAGEGTVTFMCECGRVACTTKLVLSIEAYERVRTSFDRFVIAPEHDIPSVDTVLERHDDHWVVEKQGEGGRLARRDAQHLERYDDD